MVILGSRVDRINFLRHSAGTLEEESSKLERDLVHMLKARRTILCVSGRDHDPFSARVRPLELDG